MEYLLIAFSLLVASPLLAQAPTVYRFDEAGIYLGSDPSPPSPLEPGIYLDPAKSTRTAPPVEKKGFARTGDGSQWIYVEDHGGETVYRKTDGAPIKLTNNRTNGDGYSYGPIPNQYTAIPKPGEFYEWDKNQGSWKENVAKKDETAEVIGRTSSLLRDEDTTRLLGALEAATPAQVESYVKGKIGAGDIKDPASAKVAIQKIERILIEILTLEASGRQKRLAE